MLVESASLTDWPAVAALVAGAGLPLAGLDDQFPEAFAVARDADRVVGVAGLQGHGRFGLLRSVAVVPERRGSGIGRTLVLGRLATAKSAGFSGAYLLTTSAAKWFARLGFELIDRKSAPAELLASPEFVDACPTSATCMVMRF